MKRAQFLLGRAGYWLVLAAILAFRPAGLFPVRAG